MTDAKNVIPGEDGYRPIPSLQVQSDAITYYCRGAFAAKAKDGTAYNYCGDEKNLWSMSNNAWTEANVGGGADVYGLGSDESWEFVKWGDKVIAVGGANATDPEPQIITMSDLDFAYIKNKPGADTPPRARHIAVVRNFVVLGNLYESAAAYPYRIRWCGLNDETAWVSDPATQADYQDLLGSGWVQAICGGEYGVIFTENSIWRMLYKGPPEIFSLDESPGIGTPAPNSVIQRGDTCYFWGQDGFYRTIGGQQAEPIGRHILDRRVRADLDAEYFHRMVGAEDKQRQVMWWIYPGAGNASGLPNKAVIYEYRTGRWSYAEIDVEWIYDSLGTSIDLDSLAAAGYTDLDAMTISLDSDVWKGGAVTFAAFDSAHKQNQFGGTAMETQMATREVANEDGSRIRLNRLRPVVEGGSATIKVGTRNDLEDAVTWTGVLSEQADGSVPCRVNARYVRAQVSTSGDFTRALGVLPVETSNGDKR